MATQEYATSIQGVAIRVTRLDAVGNLLNEPGDSYTTSAFIRFSFTPEYEEGDEITEKSANGAVCVSYKSPDTLKRITSELAICDPDPELTALISGGLLLTKNIGTYADPNRKSVGWAAPAVGDDPSGNGVAIEVWSRAIADGKPAATLPYWQFIFPYVKLSLSGDRVIENGLMATTFSGYGLGNSQFDTGVDGRWEFPVATDRPYAYTRVDWAPSGLKGFYTWHDEINAAISNVSATTTAVTITTSAAHDLEIGDQVTVAATTATSINGTYFVASVPTATTFTYAKTGTAVTSAADTGTVTSPAGPRAVTDLPDTTADPDVDYNVPGNVNYNADKDVDQIINSVDDPTS